MLEASLGWPCATESEGFYLATGHELTTNTVVEETQAFRDL